MSAQTTPVEMRTPPVGLLDARGTGPGLGSLPASLDVPRLDHAPADGLYLRLDAEGLALCLAERARAVCVRADFLGGRMGYRAARSSPRREAVARACGLHRRRGLRIVDATAGLGRDAFVLASAGAEVTLLECSPVVAALLEDALRRAAADPVAGTPAARMRLIRAEATAHLRSLAGQERPDVVYLDPMFAPRSRGGAVGKEMRLLQRLLGAPADARPLLAAARAAAPRVVVKRHLHAGPLAGERPSHMLAGRGTRFDVYQRAD